MTKNYLSIGEMSKIKGISVKSLRYYGELGILPPAYVNEETGYRYYTMEQIVIVDLIRACLNLGIPLKNFKRYITGKQGIDVEHLLADGKRMVAEKAKKLKESVSLLNTLSEQMARTGEVKGKAGEFMQHIPERYFLTVVFNDDLKNTGKISTKYAELFRQCNQCNIPYALNQGILLRRKNETILSQVFLEVPYPVAGILNLHCVEEGDFTCRVLKDNTFAIHLDEEEQGDFIINELIDLQIEPEKGFLEIQKRAAL